MVRMYKNKAYDLARISNLIENGRKKIISRKELEAFPIGSLISYTNVRDRFNHGGFIVSFPSEEYFIYIDADFTQKYRVRYKNVKTMYVANVFEIAKDKDIISFAPVLAEKKTNFPIFVGPYLVFYAKNKFDMKRFFATKKYVTMVKWLELFGDNKKTTLKNLFLEATNGCEFDKDEFDKIMFFISQQDKINNQDQVFEIITSSDILDEYKFKITHALLEKMIIK